MKNILIGLTIIAFFACDKSNENVSESIVDTIIEFSVLNSQNEDLLNPGNPNYIDVEGIKIFYVIDGESQEVYDQEMTYTRKYLVFKHGNEYRIRVFLNESETSDKSITYLKWSDNDTDTIEATYKRTNGIVKEKIWLNGELIWERGDNTIDAYFLLSK